MRISDWSSDVCSSDLLVVMAVGIRPNTALAKEAGLAVGRGIHVDDHMVTSDPSITAVGECVEHRGLRSEEHTSELQSLMRISYAVFCLKKKTHHQTTHTKPTTTTRTPNPHTPTQVTTHTSDPPHIYYTSLK